MAFTKITAVSQMAVFSGMASDWLAAGRKQMPQIENLMFSNNEFNIELPLQRQRKFLGDE